MANVAAVVPVPLSTLSIELVALGERVDPTADPALWPPEVVVDLHTDASPARTMAAVTIFNLDFLQTTYTPGMLCVRSYMPNS